MTSLVTHLISHSSELYFELYFPKVIFSPRGFKSHWGRHETRIRYSEIQKLLLTALLKLALLPPSQDEEDRRLV